MTWCEQVCDCPSVIMWLRLTTARQIETGFKSLGFCKSTHTVHSCLHHIICVVEYDTYWGYIQAVRGVSKCSRSPSLSHTSTGSYYSRGQGLKRTFYESNMRQRIILLFLQRWVTTCSDWSIIYKSQQFHINKSQINPYKAKSQLHRYKSRYGNAFQTTETCFRDLRERLSITIKQPVKSLLIVYCFMHPSRTVTSPCPCPSLVNFVRHKQ